MPLCIGFIILLTIVQSLCYETSCFIEGNYEFESETSRPDYAAYLRATGMNDSYVQVMVQPKKINVTQVEPGHYKYAVICKDFVKQYQYEAQKEKRDKFFDGRIHDSTYFLYDNIVIHKMKFLDNVVAHSSFLFTEKGFHVSFSCKGKWATRNYRRVPKPH